MRSVICQSDNADNIHAVSFGLAVELIKACQSLLSGADIVIWRLLCRAYLLRNELLIFVVLQHLLFGEVANGFEIGVVFGFWTYFGHQFDGATHQVAAELDLCLWVQKKVISEVVMLNLVVFNVAALRKASLQEN